MRFSPAARETGQCMFHYIYLYLLYISFGFLSRILPKSLKKEKDKTNVKKAKAKKKFTKKP